MHDTTDREMLKVKIYSFMQLFYVMYMNISFKVWIYIVFYYRFLLPMAQTHHLISSTSPRTLIHSLFANRMTSTHSNFSFLSDMKLVFEIGFWSGDGFEIRLDLDLVNKAGKLNLGTKVENLVFEIPKLPFDHDESW